MKSKLMLTKPQRIALLCVLPFLAAAAYRQAGFDYLAITDHHSAEGSLSAMRTAELIPSGLAAKKDPVIALRTE